MHEQVIKAANEVVKTPVLLKQVVILISGLVFLVFLHAHTGFDPVYAFKHFGLGDAEVSFVFLAISYISGRLLILLAGVLNGLLGMFDELLNFIFNPQPLSIRWRMFVTSMRNPQTRNKTILSFVTGKLHLEDKSPASLKNQLTLVEYARITQKYPGIDNRAELTLTSLEFTRIMLGASLVFAYVISLNYLFGTLFLLWLQEKLERSLQTTNYGLYLSAVKYIEKLGDL